MPVSPIGLAGAGFTFDEVDMTGPHAAFEDLVQARHARRDEH
jgi:hypothetical protein